MPPTQPEETGARTQSSAQAAEASAKQNSDIGQEELLASLLALQAKTATRQEIQAASLDQSHTTDANIHRNNVYAVTLQTLTQGMNQNSAFMAQTVALIGQMIRHADVAIDRTWNIDEQAHVVERILRDKDLQAKVIEALQAGE